MTDDLNPEAVAAALGDRAVRTYPAMLSTEADALAWGRAGGPAGAVVVADYQASPRGRAGLEWRVTPGQGLGFSLLVRPPWPPQREGWTYLPTCLGLADVLGAGTTLAWPDEVHGERGRAAAIGVHTELGPDRIQWATITVLVDDAQPPRAGLLATTLNAIEQRLDDAAESVLEDYRSRCATLGRHVVARLVPLGPTEVRIEGEAVDCRDDGSLVIATANGRRVAVPPQNLGLLEEPG